MRGPPLPKDWPKDWPSNRPEREPARPKGVANAFPFHETEQLRQAAAEGDIDKIDAITAELKQKFPHKFKEQ